MASGQRATKKPRWRTGMERAFTPPTLISQTAEPSPLWRKASPSRRAIETSVTGEGEESGGGDGGARGEFPLVGGSKGPEPLASPNVVQCAFPRRTV